MCPNVPMRDLPVQKSICQCLHCDSVYSAGASIYSASVYRTEKYLPVFTVHVHSYIQLIYGYGNLTNVAWLASYSVQLKSCPTTLVDSEHSLLSNPISVC